MVEDNSGTQETWNMATETLKRISLLLDLCVMHFQDGSAVPLFDTLKNLRRNLIPFMEDAEVEKLEELFDSFPEDWRSRTQNFKVVPIYYGKVMILCDEIYTFCVKIMKKKGLLMPPTVDKNKAIMGM